MEYTSNARMMLGYIDDDDDEILDYDDGNLDLSEDNDEGEDEGDSIVEVNQQYPQTPEEKIHWQEQIRMIHLRSHLNQLLEKVKNAHYVTDKTREELNKCRDQIEYFESERDGLFQEIQSKESDGKQSAVYRVRAAHERICTELEAEQNLEKMIMERLDQAEYELALAEVERGKFLLAEDDLLHREHQLSKEKTDMAMLRLHKEEQLARQAMITQRKDKKTRFDAVMEEERRHQQALDEAERSHERASKYLHKTLSKINKRQHEEAERYKNNMDKKMDMLLKLKSDIAHNRENLRAIRARDQSKSNQLKRQENDEREKILAKGGNPEEIILMKKRQNEMERNKMQFQNEQTKKKSEIMQKILLEEENMKRRKQRQHYLWNDPDRERSQRVGSHKEKPLKALEDYVGKTSTDYDAVEEATLSNKDREMLESITKKDSTKTVESVRKSGTVDGESDEECQPAESFDSCISDMSALKRVLRKLSANGEPTPPPQLEEQEEKPLKVDNKKGGAGNADKKNADKKPGQEPKPNKNKNQDDSLTRTSFVGGVEDDVTQQEVEAVPLSQRTSASITNLNEELEETEEQEAKFDQAEADRSASSDRLQSPVLLLPDEAMDDSSAEEEEDPVDLAKPEFEGLWNQEAKPFVIPKDVDYSVMKPVMGSKMDKDILKRTLEKTREGIVVQQIAAGRQFTGCPFYSKPDVIHFKDFVVGKSYKKKVLLTNVSYTVNHIKFLDITEHLKDFIKIHFDPPGQMSAGLTCEMIVTFKPMINEDLKGQVKFLTQTGPFDIPLVCSTKKCDLALDTERVDFGTAVIGETLKRSFTLTNRGALATKFDFFKVTGMKQRTLTTAGTSLGRLEARKTLRQSIRMTHRKTLINSVLHIGSDEVSDETFSSVTTDSIRAVSPDSAEVVDKTKPAGGSSVAVDAKKKSEEELEKIPEAGEGAAPVEVEVAGQDGSEELEGNAGEANGDLSEQKQDRESDEALLIQVDAKATSPDLAVSEMDDYSSLDGMRVGPLVTGEVEPFSSIRLEIIWQPTIPGKVDTEFLVSFADPVSEPLSIHSLANAIDVPVWVERQTVDLKICMFDRLYQDTIIVNNRATTALRLKFEVCKELKNHIELLPKTGYIQAQSQFSAQLKFLPRASLFEEASKFFDPETGVLEAPMIIRVADQTTPVTFTVQAVVTNSDMEFDVTDINFGYCTIHESVKKSIKLTNQSILPQQFGFVGLPEYVEVQPNDGFGTLLPLETLELDVIFSPQKTKEYKLDLVCRSVINRDFKISCKGVGVLTPLELSKQVVHFAATPLYDIASAALHVVNSHVSSNEFTHPVPRIGNGDICPVGPTSFEFKVPNDAPISISPSVGTVMPGKKCRVQVRFEPTLNDYEVRQEALRIHTKIETAREEREKEEAALREKQEKENAKRRQVGSSPEGKKNKKNKNQNMQGIEVSMENQAYDNRQQNANSPLSQSESSGTGDATNNKTPARKEVAKNRSNGVQTPNRNGRGISDELLRYEMLVGKTTSQDSMRSVVRHFTSDHPAECPAVGKKAAAFSSPRYMRRRGGSHYEKWTQRDANANWSPDETQANEEGEETVEAYPEGEGGEEVVMDEETEGLMEAEDEGEDVASQKGKGKDKPSPKGTAATPKTSKMSAAPSSTGSAITDTATPRFDPDKLSQDSPEYIAAVTSLVRQFKGQFQSVTVPCYVASGATGNPGDLSYSIHNTLYIEVHCPAIKPPVVVISDGGIRTVDFGDVSIGQTYPKSITVQNISDKRVELKSTALNPSGPFVILNASRALDPGSTHTILLTFSPAQGRVFQEELGVKALNSTLHLTLRGRGVSPLVNLSIENQLFDMQPVLVGEYVERPFTMTNTSPLAIDYIIKQDSLSQLRYQKAQEVPPFLTSHPSKKNFVGTQNENGRNVFDIVPSKGTIQAGEAKEILVTFAPDHESLLYSDGVRLELFDQEESHFFQLIGQANSRVMFLEGTEPLLPGIESLAQSHTYVEEEDADTKGGLVVAPPCLLTVRSVMKEDQFLPGVREVYAGCVRTMAISQKKNGEFSVDGLQVLTQKGFTVEPQKGMVEAGTKKAIVFTWTPPAGFDPSTTIEETITISLRCDVTEQITLMIRAMVVTE